MTTPRRGDVWLVDLSPVREHERSGTRPGLVISTDPFNEGPGGLVILLPITTRQRPVPFHVEVSPPDGGLAERSFVKCEDVRSVSTERLRKRLGRVSCETVARVEDLLRILLDL